MSILGKFQKCKSSASILLKKSDGRENKHHTWSVGELRFITPAGPEKLTLQTLSPEQRGYRVFLYMDRHD